MSEDGYVGCDMTAGVVAVVVLVMFSAVVRVAISSVVERVICSKAEEMILRLMAPGVVLPIMLGVGQPLCAFLS